MKKIANYLILTKNNDQVIVSMSAELQDDLGTIGYVKFVVGDKINLNEPILRIEASKTIMTITCPISGTVVAINQAAITNPLLLNSENIAENWLIKLQDVDFAQFNALEDAI
ncbi:Glycine cleavage system protein H [[Mycoplasma] cavipharyngis]|uniref:glycine cleavage system protein H n=1 Tax=[Mycoplasma] cavipharyngis TaxID=92757 RepID=UPI003703FABB